MKKERKSAALYERICRKKKASIKEFWSIPVQLLLKSLDIHDLGLI